MWELACNQGPASIWSFTVCHCDDCLTGEMCVEWLWVRLEFRGRRDVSLCLSVGRGLRARRRVTGHTPPSAVVPPSSDSCRPNLQSRNCFVWSRCGNMPARQHHHTTTCTAPTAETICHQIDVLPLQHLLYQLRVPTLLVTKNSRSFQDPETFSRNLS